MRNKAAEKYVIYHTIGSLLLADRVIDRLPEIISEAFVVSFPECCADMRQILIHDVFRKIGSSFISIPSGKVEHLCLLFGREVKHIGNFLEAWTSQANSCVPCQCQTAR